MENAKYEISRATLIALLPYTVLLLLVLLLFFSARELYNLHVPVQGDSLVETKALS